jgi:exonuclease SbcC
VTRVQQEIDRLTARREAIAPDTSDAAADVLFRDAQRLQTDLGGVELRLTELRRLIADAETVLSHRQEAATRHAAARERFDRLEAERLTKTTERDEDLGWIARLERELHDETARLAKELARWLDRNATERANESTLTTEIARATTTRDASIADAEKKIAANKGLLARAAEIRKATEDLKVVEQRIAALTTTKDVLRQQLTTHQQRERVLSDALLAIEQQERDLALAEENAGKVSAAPFGEDCAPCHYMTGTVQAAERAKARIPGLREAIASKPTVTTDLAQVRTAVADTEARITAANEEYATVFNLRVDLRPIADEYPHLTAAEEKIAARTQQITDARARFDTDVAAARARETERQDRLDRAAEDQKAQHNRALTALEDRITRQIAELRRTTERLDADIARATTERDAAAAIARETKDAAREADTAQAQLTTLRADLGTLTAQQAGLQVQRDELRRRQDAFAARRRELQEVTARLDARRADLRDWSVMVKAFGREGLQTLEIDAAGPTVSSFCNDLLQACFGGRFTVDLVTQAEKVTRGKDGSTHKEVFELTVYDQERAGEPRDIADLSGGERVIVEEAFKSAIALMVNSRNPQPMRTCWRDETTGALDAENALRYIAMLRRVQEIGGFHQILFVTHNAECAQLADAQVVVDGGDIAVALPPFAASLPLALA